MKKQTALLVCLAALLTVSCDRKTCFSDIRSLPKEKWAVDSTLVFQVDIHDTTAYYDMFFSLRNAVDFETRNFYAFMETRFPDGFVECDTLGFILCDKSGRWTGRGHGRLKDNKFLFQPKIRFPLSGRYTFTVRQGMRCDVVKGISDFGIIIENHRD